MPSSSEIPTGLPAEGFAYLFAPFKRRFVAPEGWFEANAHGECMSSHVFRTLALAALVASPPDVAPPAMCMSGPPGQSFAVPPLGATAESLTRSQAEVRGTVVGSGVLLDRVTPGGPASRAGLRPDDIVIAVGGMPVCSPEQLARALSVLPPGRVAHIQYVRAAVTASVDVPLRRASARRGPTRRQPESFPPEPRRAAPDSGGE